LILLILGSQLPDQVIEMVAGKVVQVCDIAAAGLQQLHVRSACDARVQRVQLTISPFPVALQDSCVIEGLGGNYVTDH
jgi:hypothetical protein